MDVQASIFSQWTSSSSFVLKSVFISFAVVFVYKIISFVFKVWRIHQTYKDYPGPSKHWLYGTIHHFPRDSPQGRLLKFLEFTKKFSSYGYFVIWNGPFSPVVVLDNPETMRNILKTAEPKPRGPTGGYRFLLPWLGDGLLISGGQKWVRSRRLLTPAFHFDILKLYVKINNEAAQILIDKLDNYATKGTKFEVFQQVCLCTLDIILRCAFSYDIDPQRQGGKNPYVQAVNDLSVISTYRSRTPYLHPDIIFYLTPSGRKFKRLCDYVHSEAEKVINQRQKTLDKVGAPSRKHLDFLDVLLTARDENGVGLSKLEIRNEVDTFLFEGHDTTASAITWILYSLAKHQDIQRKVQQEIDEVLADRDSDVIEWSDLPKFEYLTMCIKEGMRLHCPVAMIGRETTKELDLGDRILPPGSQINVNIWALHHNEKVWKEPMKYNPERFSKENITKMDSYQFVPFSAGPRNCIGQNFALNEEKVVLARLLRRFTFELDPDHVVNWKLAAVMRSENGIMMYAKRR